MQSIPPDLLDTIGKTEPVNPMGWFRFLHNSFLGRYREMMHFEFPLANAWQEVAEIVADHDDPAPSELLEPSATHAWLIGRYNLLALADHIWSDLPQLARIKILAGASEHLKDDGVADWILEKLEGIHIHDRDSALELGCNAIYFSRDTLFEKTLTLSQEHLEQRIDRITPLGDEGERWREQLAPLADRLIDLWLEAAVRLRNHALIRRCVSHGADPNLPIWQLERSYNEKHSVLSYLLHEEISWDFSMGEPMWQLIDELLDAGADPQGIEYEGKNKPLAAAFQVREFADHLLDRGARFEGGNLKQRVKTAGCESTILSPIGLRLKKEDYEWAEESMSDLIDFEPIDSVPYYHHPNAQGGYYTTFIESFFREDDLEGLRHFESRGLSTKLTIALLLSAMRSGAYHCLRYLLKESKNPEEAFERILSRRPSFATQGYQRLCRAEPDGSNVIDHFNTYGQTPFQLPDGSRYFANLDSIAAPGHEHGPVPPDSIFVELVDATYRREPDYLVTTDLKKRWRLVPIPGTEKQHFKRTTVQHLLQMVKETDDGRFILLGITLSQFGWSTKLNDQDKAAFREWEKSSEGEELIALANKRVAAQDNANLRTPDPILSHRELEGYPREFWPYLRKLDNGLIGMTEESAASCPNVFYIYRIWERQNKPDETFVPDPRLCGSALWEQIPEELRPYFYYDEVFKKPSVRHNGRNDYEKAMISKAIDWNNNLFMEAFKAMEAAEKNAEDET